MMTGQRLLILAVLNVLILSPRSGAAAETTWGMAAGSPQLIAATMERSGDTAARLGIHAGTILVASSVGIRVLFVSRSGTGLYAFAGGGMFHIAEGDGGGAVGATPFGWVGAGVRFGTGPLTWSGELGGMFGMDTSKGYSSALPSIAIGVGFGRN